MQNTPSFHKEKPSYKTNFAPLMKDDEQIAFDPETRCLVFNGTQVARLSHLEARFLLALAYFCPYEAPDSFLALAYVFEDISQYYDHIALCTKPREQDVVMPVSHELIKDGIERLRKKLRNFGIMIPRSYKSGYALKRRGV